MIDEIYVILDKQGNLWKKKTRGVRRAVYAFKSEAKARAVLKQIAPHQDINDVVIKRYVPDEIRTDYS